MQARTDPDTRFWGKVEKTDGCWLWRAGLDTSGYGHMLIERKIVLAHRYAYEHLVGPIPDGLEIDHLCRVRSCVNPAHLEPVTKRENHLRSPINIAVQHRAQTHCSHGHPYNQENTHYRVRGDKVHRVCRICALANLHRCRAKAKQTGATQ